MKIANVKYDYNINFGLKKLSCESKNNNKSSNEHFDNDKYMTFVPCNEYWYNLMNIKFPIRFLQGDNAIITIDRKTVKKHLTKENGELDRELVETFININKNIAQELKDVINAEFERSRQYFEDEEDEESRARIEGYYLRQKEKALSNLPEDSLVATAGVFELSKTPNGYDFSDVEQKMATSATIEDIILNSGLEDKRDEIYEKLISCCYDKNDCINVNILENVSLALWEVLHILDKDEVSLEELFAYIDNIVSNSTMINSVKYMQ